MVAPAAFSATVEPGWLLHELTEAGVLDSERAASVGAEFQAAAGAVKDASGLADFLVLAGLLTPYQADRALAGDIGKLALGPYLLLEPVGGGNLGTVYRAQNRNDRQRYAVKVLPLRSMWNVLRAKAQVDTFASLPRHPAIVPFVDVGTAAGSHYLTWPFVEGEAFDRLVRRAGPLPPSHACRFLAQIADALAVCHAHGIVHGLLKPSNVLLGPDRKAHLLDLGIGAILSENIADDESMLDTISTANTTLGMMDCAPPETFSDPTQRTIAGDMYSFGCVLYYLLTGIYPFPLGNAVDKIIAHQTQTAVPVRTRNPQVPVALAELVEQLLRKVPSDRPSDMSWVRWALLDAVPDAGRSSADLPIPESELQAATVQDDPGSWVTGRVADRPVRDESAESISFNVPEPQDTPVDPKLERVTQPLVETVGPKSVPPSSKPRRFEPGSGIAGAVGGRGRLQQVELPGTPVNWAEPSADTDLSIPVVEVPLQPFIPGLLAWRTLRVFAFWLRAKDVIQISVFGPAPLSPGQTSRFQVYVHPPAAFTSVRTLSRAFQPDTELLSAGFATSLIPRGSEVGIHLSVANVGVAQSLVRFTWVGQTRPWAFQVYVPWESPAGRSPAVLTIGLDNVQVAKLPFEVVVLPRSG